MTKRIEIANLCLQLIILRCGRGIVGPSRLRVIWLAEGKIGYLHFFVLSPKLNPSNGTTRTVGQNALGVSGAASDSATSAIFQTFLDIFAATCFVTFTNDRNFFDFLM
jgi:hypothetical protein